MALPNPMRVAVLGAFPFPYPQGSQVFVAEHTRALVRSGVEAELFTYGSGVGEHPSDLNCIATPGWLSPNTMRSGPTLAKFPADAGLLSTYIRRARVQPFDVAFAHNAEAAMIALAGRAVLKTPVIYVAHTILRHELSAYGADAIDFILANLGGMVDRFIGRHADGIVALCNDAKRDLGSIARGPVDVIAPGLDPTPSPTDEQVARACAKFAITPGSYALYCGNLDAYQDLDLLAEAASIMGDDPTPNIVVATHDKSTLPASFEGVDNIACVEVENFAQMRALISGSQSVVLCRRRRGGFPIKLLNYMEARKPIVAFEDIASGFEHMTNAWLLDEKAEAGELAAALRTLAHEPALRQTLGAGARELLETHHGWEQIAQRTCALAESVMSRH